MRRKFDFYEIQVSYKFESLKECDKKIKALIEFIKYHAKEGGYFCQGIIVSSDTESENLLSVKKEKTKGRGRPKVCKVISNYEMGPYNNPNGTVERRFVKVEAKEIKVKPHIHMFFLHNPSATFVEIIRVYIIDTFNGA